jgi:hypothetical protein
MRLGELFVGQHDQRVMKLLCLFRETRSFCQQFTDSIEKRFYRYDKKGREVRDECHESRPD